MSASTEEPKHQCRVCTGPPKILCEHTQPDGSTSITAYCSSKCKKKNRQKHKAECQRSKHRQHLYQAGQILQDVFYIFRRKMWDWNFGVRKTDDGKLAICFTHVEEDNGIVWEYRDFDGLTEDDQATIFTFNACVFPHINFTDLIRETLAGCVESVNNIEELTIDVHEHNKRITPDPDLPFDDRIHKLCKPVIHDVFLITLKDNRQYILDLAGAQFGQMRAVVPFEEYEAAYIQREYSREALGTIQRNMALAVEEGTEEVTEAWAIQGLFVRFLDRSLGSGAIPALASEMSRERFETRRADMVRALSDGVDEGIQKMGGYWGLQDMFDGESEEIRLLDSELRRLGLM